MRQQPHRTAAFAPATAAALPDAMEHIVLLRHWAGVQDRVSRQMCEQARRCEALEAELLRLRARWVIATTQMLWGMGWPTARLQPHRAHPAASSQTQPDALPESAADWICQTGCASHAHHWLGDEGECRLHGGDCTRIPVRAGSKVPSTTA